MLIKKKNLEKMVKNKFLTWFHNIFFEENIIFYIIMKLKDILNRVKNELEEERKNRFFIFFYLL